MTKTPLYNVLFLAAAFFFGCNDHSVTMNEPQHPFDQLERRILSDGDTNAYKELRTAYLDSPPRELLFWGLFMANRYDYSQGYLDVFYSLKESFCPTSDNYSLAGMDERTKKMALEYLEIAVKKNAPGASNTLDSVKERLSVGAGTSSR